jgi:cytidylate kinase
MLNIALSGSSGSGKSTIAGYLACKYGYLICNTGRLCREICLLLFDSESKTILNRVTDYMKSIDENVWLRAALKTIKNDKPIVIDSIRFRSDYQFCRNQSFQLWKIEAPLEERISRLNARKQEFNPKKNGFHPAETELEDFPFDNLILNSKISKQKLFEFIDRQLSMENSHSIHE